MAKENNGGAGKVIFVVSLYAISISGANVDAYQDTEGTFRPRENIVPIAERFGTPNTVKQLLVFNLRVSFGQDWSQIKCSTT